MKKFKHKKTGEIAEEYPDYYRTRYWSTVNDIPKRLVEDSSDWEEVIPKEWEILSFVNEYNKLIYQVHDTTCYPDPGKWEYWIPIRTLDYCNRFYKIHSVKRLSDNTIITLGDRAQTINKYPHTIKSIEIRQKSINRGEKDGIDRIWLNWENDSGGNWLESVEKVEVLHKSFEGTDISTGETYYIVDNFRVREVLGGTFTKSKWDGFRFKIKEYAEYWILYNKPCLSLKDVIDNTGLWGSEIEDIENLVKMRL